jgi:MFS superfamily sulfate permease-like transporter
MIAYASLAGLPPQAGLYTLLASLFLYAVFGTSKQLVVAGTSASAVLVYSAITALHPKDAPTYTALAAGLIILTGVLFLASGLFRLGFITQFLSRPVMEGFVFGLAIFVTVGQLPKLFGLAKGPGDTIRQFVHLLAHLGDASWVTFAVGAVALVLLFALGLANIASGLLGGLAAGGSLSQTAVNDGAGARSELSPVVAAVLSLITVLALTPLFTNLPEAVLAAMIIHAVSHLMKVAEMRRFYRLVPREFWLGMITLLGVVILDVLPGLVIGVIFSILILVYRASRPTFSVLGTDRDMHGAYEDIKRHPSAQPLPGVLIIRPDAPLFYANAQPFRDTVTQLVSSSPEAIHTLILDLDANDELDITSSEALGKLLEELGGRHVRIGLAHVHATTAEMMRRAGILDKVGTDHIFPNLEIAVTWASTAIGNDDATR